MPGAFSPSDAAVEGFRAVGRHWRLVVGWALFNVVAFVALCVVLVVLLFAVVPFAGSRQAAGSWGAEAGAAVLGLGVLFVQLMIACGYYRLKLRPTDPGFLHLRIGADEVRVLGASLLVVIAIVPPALVAGGFVIMAGRVSPWAAAIVAAAGALAVWLLLLRLELTPVIAFAERRISLAESWRRTRGQSWRLLGMALLLVCLIVLLAVVLWLLAFVVTGLATGFGDLGLSESETLSAHPARYVLQVGIEFLLVPVWIVIAQAPWVAVYKALTRDPA